MMTVRNMQSANGNTVPNQFVISGNNCVTFQSYTSTIATIDYTNATIEIGEDWDYSMTTGKYRNAFFDEMCFGELATKKGLEKALSDGSITSGGRRFSVYLA